MDQNLLEILDGREGNHLLPFLWMHDDRHALLPGMVQSVYDSGARAFCVESRPHNHFCEDEWWHDMETVLREARSRDMKVWILDDRHFPTGYANGLLAKKYPERGRWQLIEEHVDVVGPARESAILLREHRDGEDGEADDVLLGVFAYRRAEAGEVLEREPIDLTGNARGRYVFFDVPQGVFRVFALYQSRRGTWNREYIHMIDPDSVKVLIEAVYETHYAHFGAYFGNTIAGFFSDEPSFGNTRVVDGGDTPSMYDQRLGQPGLALPWSAELLARMNRKLGRNALGDLAGLWYTQGDGLPEVRIAYMDAVTTLWREAFSLQVGDWCRAHNVMYIGHVIEDMNAHARLSCTGGHFFRALDGQDMAGIDVVLHQIMPGLSQFTHVASAAGGYADPVFFDYVLAKLASSHAHIQPRMKKRAMCEIFGAYGWAEGVPMMKYLLDHMLVRGINYFVPHAFSPDYPDPDCPPHFNAGGHNPQFRAFGELMRYANKVAHLFENSEPVISAAILYHAEAEWSGRDYMLMQEPAKALCDAQINYEFVPFDALLSDARIEEGILCIGAARYPALIIPYAAYLPKEALARLAALERDGMRLIMVDGRPEGFSNGAVVGLGHLAAHLRGLGLADVRSDKCFAQLRYLHTRRAGSDLFLFVNESMDKRYTDVVSLPVKGTGVLLDLPGGGMYRVDAPDGKLRLNLGYAQSAIFVFDGEGHKELPAVPVYDGARTLACGWTLRLRRAETDDSFDPAIQLDSLYNVTGAEGDPGFSGEMRYELVFEADGSETALDLGLVGDTVEATLNGVPLGIRFCAPHVFNLTGAIQAGANRLSLTIANTLVHAHPDPFSRFVQIAPSGLLGPVQLLKTTGI